MGRIDLFNSRRTNYFRCEFWIRDERTSIGDASKWVNQNQPAGLFYAKPIVAKSNEMNVVSGVWALDRDHIAIETEDQVDDLKRGCIVRYDDNIWLVESVQSLIHLKQSEFNKHPNYKTIISLTKG